MATKTGAEYPAPNQKITLRVPPRIMPHGELAPIIEPRLRDLVPFPGAGQVEEWELFSSEPGNQHLSGELVQELQQIALGDPKVQKLLEGKRHRFMGVMAMTDAKTPQGEKAVAPFYAALFFNYSDNRAIEARIDATSRSVSAVERFPDPCPPRADEIAEAIRLASVHPEVTKRLTQDLQPNAILISPIDPADPAAHHRQFEVGFGRPDERLSRFKALVDMSTEAVVKVSEISGGGMHREEGRS